MKVQLGPITLSIDVDAASPDILEMSLKDILTTMGVSIQADTKDDLNISATSREKLTPAVSKRNSLQTKKHLVSESSDDAVDALKRADISDKTIVSISKRIFHRNDITQSNFPKLFSSLKQATEDFLTRPIKEEIWALYAAPVEIKNERPKICVIGLNSDKQLIVLTLDEGTPAEVFDRLIKRGLNPKQIELGIISFELNAMDVFKDKFRRAGVQLDWNEYIDLSTGAETKLRLKNAMVNYSAKEVEKLIDQIEAPQELLTYLDFPKDLHRALKTTNPIKRLAQDVNQRLRRTSYQQHDTVYIWSILRLQFQWLRIPVDSDQLTTLAYIKNPSIAIQE